MGKIFTKTTRSRQNIENKDDVGKFSQYGDGPCNTENLSSKPEFPDLDHLRPNISDEIQAQAVKDLLVRLIPNHAHKFLVDVKRSLLEDGKDVFQLTKQQDGCVLITGTTGVSAATGFNHYLKYYCNGQVSWETANLNIPDELPPINLTVVCQDRFRYYQNVCTGSYSFVWWSWADWEKHIDWMVLNSYNLVLSLNGLEGIWKRVYTKLNLTVKEIDEHFTGPAFLAWGTMGNLRGWGGPLPESWILRSVELQHQILKRMREFGVIPVLPAFAGHVPRAFKRLFPDANLTSATKWLGFNDSYCCPLMVEPTDTLFETIGTMFMEELTDEFGTNHVYSCDSFNEMTPKNDSVSYLRDMGLSVYKGMSSYDPQAIWLMQGWLFVNEKWFWTEDRAEALLTSVPKGRMIILDLKSEQEPQYGRLKSYFGQPFIWCMLHNFGGTLGMYGSSISVNTKVHLARTMQNSTMIGTGLTTEGINQNYVIYELMSESSWRSEPTNLENWFDLYTIRRYGENDARAIKSWRILKDTLYNYNLPNQMHGKCVVTIRPSTQYRPRIWYKECDLVEAWDYLLQASNLQESKGYRHDLVDVTRQILQVLVDKQYLELIKIFKQRNVNEFQNASAEFLDMFLDLEKILQSNQAFLLGNWLNAAKRIGLNSHEVGLYEYNARNQITLWGPNGEIIDYANKQWSGMVSDYYFLRWQMFINAMNESLINQTPINEPGVIRNIFQEVESPFTFSRKEFPIHPSGDSVEIAQDIKRKWWNKLQFLFCSEEDVRVRQ